jgi:uncharacterized OB-fold protein
LPAARVSAAGGVSVLYGRAPACGPDQPPRHALQLQPVGAGRAEFESPYYVAYVEMPEGVRVFTQLLDVDPSTIACDMPVELGSDGRRLTR